MVAAKTARDLVLARLVLRSHETPNVRINGTRITIRRSEITNGHTGICVSVGGGFERWGIAHGAALLRNRIHDCGPCLRGITTTASMSKERSAP